METEKWCMCENLDGVSVARDMKSTCGRCRGSDAYGSSPMRPEKYRKQLKAKRDIKNLHQCPCYPATTCKMDEPCLGCETYAEWLRGTSKLKWATIDELKRIDKYDIEN